MTFQEQSCPICGLSPASSEHIISCQADMIKKLEMELAELKQRLSHYENSNTPPSKNSLIYREMKKKRKEEQLNRENSDAAAFSSSPISKKPVGRMGTWAPHKLSLRLATQSSTQWRNAPTAGQPDCLSHRRRREF
jgi:hypothetical protein